MDPPGRIELPPSPIKSGLVEPPAYHIVNGGARCSSSGAQVGQQLVDENREGSVCHDPTVSGTAWNDWEAGPEEEPIVPTVNLVFAWSSPLSRFGPYCSVPVCLSLHLIISWLVVSSPMQLPNHCLVCHTNPLPLFSHIINISPTSRHSLFGIVD